MYAWCEGLEAEVKVRRSFKELDAKHALRLPRIKSD